MANFGVAQIGKTTPQWAKYMFRIYFFMSKAFIGWAAATTIFSPEFVTNANLMVTLLIDPVFYGFSKMFGVTPEESELEKLQNETDKN